MKTAGLHLFYSAESFFTAYAKQNDLVGKMYYTNKRTTFAFNFPFHFPQ